MAGMNSQEHDDTQEESVNNSKKTDTGSIETKLYNAFIEEKIQKQGVGFINTYMKMDSESEQYKDEVMKYIDENTEFDSLGETFRDDISLGKIQSRILGEYTRVKTQRFSFKKHMLQYYDITNTQYNSKIEGIISKLDAGEIKTILGSSETVKHFFESNNITLPEKKSYRKIFEQLDIEKSIKKLSPEKQQEIRETISEAAVGLNVHSTEFVRNMETVLKTYLSEGVFSVQEKRELIRSFIPSINLQKALDYGLLKEKEVLTYLKNNFGDGLKGTHKNDYIKSLRGKIHEIEIGTEQLKFSSEKTIEAFVKNEDFKRFGKEIQDFYAHNSENVISSFDDLSEKIEGQLGKKIEGLSYMGVGNMLEIRRNTEKGETTQYYKIISTSRNTDPNNYITLQNQGGNGIYDSKKDNITGYSYGDFFDILASKDKVASASFYDIDFFETKVDSGEINSAKIDYSFESQQDKEAKKHAKRVKFAQRLYTDKVSVKLLEGDALDEAIKNFTDKQAEKYSQEISSLQDSESKNISNLLTEIDKIDTKGVKFGFEVGTTFHVAKTDDLYTILEVDENYPGGKIVLSGIGGEKEVATFEEFVEMYEQHKAVRTSKVPSIDSFIDDINADETLWSGIDMKNDTIVNKEYDDEKNRECDFLVSSGSDDCFFKKYSAIKIHNISGGMATISFGKIEKKDIKKGGQSGKDTIYSINNQTVEVSLGMISSWVKKAKLKPKNLDGENAEEVSPNTDGRKGSFKGWFFKNFSSISSLGAAAKMWTDNFTNYFSEGESERAMELLNRFGFTFSKEQEASMKMRKEQAEKKSADEAMELLKVLDSGPATEMIEGWIMDKHTSESKKIGAMLYMLEKYGTLYEKKALIKHKGDFIWYKALGGCINPPDALYVDYKKECEAEDAHFTEEDLVYRLMSKQCKSAQTGYKPERRGRLYKEVEAIMGKGIGDEMEKGKGDADKKGTYAAKVNFALGELRDGAHPNAIGAMESIINKGGGSDVGVLNKLPFVMLASGAFESFPAQMTNKFKAKSLILSSFFTHSQSHGELYNNVVIQLCSDIQKKLPDKYPSIGNDAEKLIRGLKGASQTNRVDAAVKFYDDYQGILGRSLLGLNSRKVDKESEFETWIQDHEDEEPLYKEYRKILDIGFVAITDGGYLNQNEDLLKDAYSSAFGPGTGGISGYDVEAFTNEYLIPQTGSVGFRNNQLGNMFWAEITGQIDATANNPDLDITHKKKRITRIMTGFMDGIRSSYAQRPGEIDAILKNPADVFYTHFRKWDVKNSDFALEGGTFKESEKGQKIIDKYVSNILSGTSSSSSHDDEEFSLDDVLNETQQRTAENLDS